MRVHFSKPLSNTQLSARPACVLGVEDPLDFDDPLEEEGEAEPVTDASEWSSPLVVQRVLL